MPQEAAAASGQQESEPSVSVKKPGNEDDFLKFLRRQPTVAAAAPAPRPTFNVRVISGTKVDDVRLELARSSASGETADPAFPIWKVSSSTTETKAQAAPETTLQEPPAAVPEPPLDPLPPKAKKAKSPTDAKPREGKGLQTKEMPTDVGTS